jgi:hypothetical protein
MTVGTPRQKPPQVRQIGDTLGVVGDNGTFTPTYTAPEKPKEDKPNLPTGYVMGPDGKAHLIDGLPQPKAAQGYAIPQAAASDLEGKVSAFSDLARAVNSFKDDFSGPGSKLESMAQGVLGVGTPGQRDWWADFSRTDNITRNAIFGASLSEGEKAAYEATTVTPNMKPAEIKRNLERRLQIARKVLSRKKDFLLANGYNPQAVDALLNGVDLNAAPETADPVDLVKAVRERVSRGDDPAETIQWLLDNNYRPSKEMIAQIVANKGNPDPTVVPPSDALANTTDALRGEPGYNDVLIEGATLGLQGEAAGVGNAIYNAVSSPFTDAPFDPVEAYREGRDVSDARVARARQNTGGAGTAVEIAGSLASGNASNALATLPTLGGRVLQGVKAGAAGGGVAGYGYGQGLNSLLTAGGGALAGGALGGAIPLAGSLVGNRVQGLRRLTGKDQGLPRRIVGEAIEADGASPAAVGQVMDQAHGRGSPMMLADTGDNARELLASVGRQPGPSRKIVNEAVGERQKAQAERISSAVARDLGPTANIREMGDALVDEARKAAGPLYDKAYAAPGASVVKLDDLATRPAFVKALKNAINLSLEEGADPTALAIQFDAPGNTNIDRQAASWQTLDYVKRGLDDVLEKYRDKTTGKLVLDGQGRAAKATLQTLIARMDKVNPAYGEARAAYAGPAKMREALDKGVKALSKAPDDIMATMKPVGEGEKEAYRLGVRKAIVDMLGSRKDGGDKVSILLGTPKSRAVLTRVFGGNKEFERFVSTLRDEEAMGRTFKSVFGNSDTAKRVAQDAHTNDQGLVESALDAGLRGGKDGMWSAVVAGLQKLRDVDRFGAGKAGERTRESIAALLSETDPKVLRELVAAAQKASRKQQVRAGQRSRNAVRVGRNVGDLTGMSLGRVTGPRE